MGRRAGQAPLSRAKILATALEVIDEAGLEGLSMRRLGKELGVDPMAVYHHVPNKEELLRAVVHDVFSRMPSPATEGPWRDRVRSWAHAYRDLALAHPNLVLRIVTDAQAVSVAAGQINASLQAALETGGLPPRAVSGGVGLIVDYVNGYVLAAVSFTHPVKDKGFDFAIDTILAGLVAGPHAGEGSEPS
jgi:AcrR family transcriptional regulator